MHLTRESSTRGTAVASESPSGIMPVGGSTAHAHRSAGPAHMAPLRSRAHDFLSLTKPRVLLLVLIATGLGCVMASEPLDLFVLAHALIGTVLVAGGTAALNQYIERAHDARMRRTARRPLPAGRLQPQEVLWWGGGQAPPPRDDHLSPAAVSVPRPVPHGPGGRVAALTRKQ
jgi:UbiA prenyltransferase family